MLRKPDNKTLLALNALQGNSDFEQVREWLAESLHDLYVDGSTAKDEYLVRWHQGAAQAVHEFLDKAANAHEVIRKSR